MKQLIDTVMPDLEVTVFSPTREMQQAKANYWSFFLTGDVSVSPRDTLESAQRYGRDSRIKEWWSKPGFRQWFSNKDEFRQRAEFLANNSLMHLEYILNDEKSKGSEKVAAIKLIMELSGKLKKADSAEQFADAKIAQMGREELEEFIRNKSRTLIDDQITKPN